MGFFGIVSAIGSAISGAVSTFASGVGSLCSSIGGGFLSTVSGALGTIVSGLTIPLLSIPQIGVVITIIQAATKIISSVAEALGIKKKEETPEELAMKAEKSNKTPDDFESNQEYINYIRNEIELTKEEKQTLEKMSPEEKAKYQIIGNSLYIKEIKEKYNVEIPEEFWVDMAKVKASGEEVKAYLDVFNENGFRTMKDMTAYMKGEKLSEGTKASTVSNAMYEAIKRENPELNDEDIATMINRNPDKM